MLDLVLTVVVASERAMLSARQDKLTELARARARLLQSHED